MLWLKQSTAVTFQLGAFVDKGDGVTPETGLATNMDNASTGIRVSKNGATQIDRNSATAPAHDDDGYYKVELSTTDTNTLGTLHVQYEELAVTLPAWKDFMVVPANVWDAFFGADNLQVDATQILGGAIPATAVTGVPDVNVTHQGDGAIPAPAVTGVPDVNLTHHVDVAASVTNSELDVNVGQIVGTAPTLTGGDLDVNVATLDAAALTAIEDEIWDALKSAHVVANSFGDFLDIEVSGRLASADINLTGGAVDTVTAVTNAVTVGTMNANVIDAASIAASALDDKGNWEVPIFSGTSDAGGSTTSMVDAALVEINDEWNGSMIRFTSAGLDRQARLITNFDAGTDTITFAPAVTETLAAGFTYEIWQHAASDVQSWLGTVTALAAPNALVGGAVDADISALQANVITSASINAAALNGKGDWNIGKTGYSLTQSFPTNFADMSITVTTGLVDITQTAADKVWATAARILTASTNFNDVSTAEVLTQVNTALDTAISELGVAQPATTPTIRTALMLLYMALRNKLDVQTSGTDALEIHNDAGTQITSKLLTDSGGDYSEAKMT